LLLENPANAAEELDQHNIDFNSIRKQLKKHAFRSFLIVEDEFRDIWTSSGCPFRISCSTRKLLPRAKCWIKTLPPSPPRPFEAGQLEQLIEDQWAQMQTLLKESESENLSTMPSKKDRPSP
jgi:hypothetical protein